MKKLVNLAIILVVCLSMAGIAQAQANNLITENSAGKVKLGMTVAEVRQAVKPMTLIRTSDGEGIALIAVNQGKNTTMTLYAGEENPDAKINENAKIQQIEVWDKSFQTAENVRAGMLLSEAEKKYGKVTKVMMSEIEAREYAEFTNQPKGLDFRLTATNETAGIYPNGERETTKYAKTASLLSILVTGLNESAKTYKSLDVTEFNQKIEKADSENWAKMPTQIIARLIPKFEEIKSRTIEIVAASIEENDFLTVFVTDDGFLDDSVRGEKHKFELKMNEQGVWKVVSASKAWRCWEGRGHQDYSTEPCI